MPEFDDDRPWTEAQWAAFMKEADLRAARHGELLETLLDHPDRDEIIDHEMGWDQEPSEEVIEGLGNLPETSDALAKEDDEEPVEDIPVYRRISALGESVSDLLEQLMKGAVDESDEAAEVGEAFINVHIAAAKIAGGHGMGYDDDVLCGNIVNNRIALESLGKAADAWKGLRSRQTVSAKEADDVLRELAECRQDLAERIEDLRSRVWW